MKIRNILLMVTLVCFSLLVIGCSSYRSDKILSRVLNNKTTFITESGKTTYLKEYKIGEGTLSTPFDADPSKYVFVDMDGDRKNELVINISNDYGYYLVLHYNGKNVYGFEFTVRSLMSLKTDGSFMQSGGAASSSYCKISFDDDGYTIIDEAIKDSTMGKFELKAVDGVSFDIYKGEVFGLVGESGCGKTTTGRSIIRLYDITGGSVYYKGD